MGDSVQLDWEHLERVRLRVNRAVEDYCLRAGASPGPGVNNLVPHDAVRAFAMARHLTAGAGFDEYIAVAPEGHIYSFFFDQLGRSIKAVHVPYPPTACQELSDLRSIRGQDVLVIEDDLIGGGTLRLVTAALQRHEPRSISLYLGHSSFVQKLENVPSGIVRTFVAESMLDPGDYPSHAADFVRFFDQQVT